jgi:chromosome segregation ATPase
MNTRLALPTLATAVLALASFQGCKSTGADEVEQTSSRLDAFSANIEKLQRTVADVSASLGQVVETASTDPKPAFKEFSKHAGALEESTKKARANLDKAQAEGAKLFEAWTKNLDTISDEDIRESSAERRDQLQKALGAVADEAAPALTDLEAYVATTKDLHTYLSQDLTPSGIKGISGKADDLADSAESITSDLDDVVDEAKKAAAKFATAKPPAPAK